MLAIKYTPNIFLISIYVTSLFQQNICCVKVCVLKNWEQLILSKLILYLLGQEYGIYFLLLTYIFTRQLRNIHEKKSLDPRKYPRVKFWTHEKKLWTHEIPTRKKLRTHEGTAPRWHEAHEGHDDTRPAEFSTLDFWR